MTHTTKALRIVGLVLAVYVILVATHRGEFWPFSIYPMFSQAGQPWSRSIVRTLPDDASPPWTPTALHDLPGDAFPLRPQGVNQNDVANYVSKTDRWTRARLRGLRSVLSAAHDFSAPLLVMRARGRLMADSVAVTATPLIVYTANDTRLHPSIAASADSTNRFLKTGVRSE